MCLVVPAYDIAFASETTSGGQDVKVWDSKTECIPSGDEARASESDISVENAVETHRQHFLYGESFNDLGIKEEKNYTVAPSAVDPSDVNMYSDEGVLNRNSPVGTMNLQAAEPGRNTFEMCSAKCVELSA